MQANAPDLLAILEPPVSLALSLLSILISVIAIWQALYMYRVSNDLNQRLVQALEELKSSARSTEATTTQVTTRALDVLAGHFERRVDEAERQSRLRVAEGVAEALHQAPSHERLEAQAAATRAVSDAFAGLKAGVAPTASDYDWGPFIRRMNTLERNNEYLSVKWLHQSLFAEDLALQEALQAAIELQVLRTYHRSNPARSRFPTLCCELDREHPVVKSALRTGSRHPVRRRA
jgi:hypothetical protein